MSRTYRRKTGCPIWTRHYWSGMDYTEQDKWHEKEKRKWYTDSSYSDTGGNQYYKYLGRKTRRSQQRYDCHMIKKNVDHDYVDSSKLNKKHAWSVW